MRRANVACHRTLNILAVRGYGEAEFWLSGGKVILIFILFAFTFITMVGGNPHHVSISTGGSHFAGNAKSRWLMARRMPTVFVLGTTQALSWNI